MECEAPSRVCPIIFLAPEKIEHNIRLFKSKVFEALHRPVLPRGEAEKLWYYPYVQQLKSKYGEQIKEMVIESSETGVEKGAVLCADEMGNIHLGEVRTGTAGRVMIYDCVMYPGCRPVGTIHTHPRYEPYFSYWDIVAARPREEFSCVAYKTKRGIGMKCYSPVEYWKFSPEKQREIDAILAKVRRVGTELNTLAMEYRYWIDKLESGEIKMEELPESVRAGIYKIWSLTDEYESLMRELPPMAMTTMFSMTTSMKAMGFQEPDAAARGRRREGIPGYREPAPAKRG